MKKNFNTYALIWGIILVAFNAIVFLMRSFIPVYVMRYDSRFWVIWTFVLVAFIGNLACVYMAFKAESLQKLFYNLALISISRFVLVCTLIAGGAVLLIPEFPIWIAAIICVILLSFQTIVMIKMIWTAGTVSQVEEKINERTTFIKNLTVDVESLMASTKSSEARAACKRVYEAVRYSDPVSNDALSSLEVEIAAKMKELVDTVAMDETDQAKTLADGIVVLVEARNKKCRLLKGEIGL